MLCSAPLQPLTTNYMISNEHLLTLLVGIPFVGAFALPAAGALSERARNALSLVFVLASFACASLLLPCVFAGETVTVAFAGVDVFYADGLALFMALVSSGVGAIIVFYSFGYIAHYEFRNEYYFMVVLFLASMMGLVFSRNLIALFVFWEITAIACWRLIGFFRKESYVWKADKAFLVTVFGALLMLLGFVMVADRYGSFDMGVIKTASAALPVSNLAVALILVGMLSKSATLPLHTWLPDAGVAPSPVTALLHAAVLVKIGVYVFARLFVATFTIDEVWHTAVPIIAASSALVAGGAALIDTDLKRIIAFSTISQIGFIFLGLAVGNEIGLAGALLFILMHGIAKAGLFLCAGVVEQNTHVKDITRLGGLASTMPFTAAAFAACSLSVMGIPPFGGFFSKYMVIAGAVTSGQFAVSFAFIVGAVLTILYLFRVFTMVFLGEARSPEAVSVREGSPSMVFSVVLLAALALTGGLLIGFPTDFLRAAVAQMMGS